MTLKEGNLQPRALYRLNFWKVMAHTAWGSGLLT